MADVGISVQLQGLDSVNRGLDSLSTKTKQVGESALGAAANTKALSSSFETLKGVIGSLGLVGLFMEAKRYIDNTLTSMEQLGRTSKALGVSSMDLQRWQFGAERMGASAEDVDQSLKFLNRTLGDMTIGVVTPAVKLLAQLGVNMDAVKKGTLSTGEAFKTAILSIQRIPDAATRTAVGMQVFGRGFENMLAAVNDPVQWNYLMQHFDELGLGINKNMVDYLADAHSKFKDFGAALENFAEVSIGLTIMKLEQFGTAIGRLYDESQKFNTPGFGQSQGTDIGLGGFVPRGQPRPTGVMDMKPFTSGGISIDQGPLNIHLPTPEEIEAGKKYAQTIAQIKAAIDEATHSSVGFNYQQVLDQSLLKAGTTAATEKGKAITGFVGQLERAAQEQKAENDAESDFVAFQKTRGEVLKDIETNQEKYLEQLDKIRYALSNPADADALDRAVRKLAKDTADADTVAKGLGDDIANALEKSILGGGKLKDIFKGLVKDLETTLVHEVITKNISSAIAGALHGIGGGANLFEGLGKWLSGESPFLTGLQHILQSAWNALPGILDDAWSLLKSILGSIGGGGGGGLGSIIGDIASVAGSFLGFAGGGDLTVTAPRLIMVGERGPERLSVRPMAGGGSHGDGGSYGGIHIHLPPSSVLSNVTAPTYARMVARAVARENRRRV